MTRSPSVAVALSDTQRDELADLGWTLEDKAAVNYHSELSVEGGPDAVVALFEATLKVYAIDPRRLKLEFLSGKVCDQYSADMTEVIEPLDAEGVLATFSVDLLPGETISSSTRGVEEGCAIATSRRVFVVKRMFLGQRLNEWEYKDLTDVRLDVVGETGVLVLEGPRLKVLRAGDDQWDFGFDAASVCSLNMLRAANSTRRRDGVGPSSG